MRRIFAAVVIGLMGISGCDQIKKLTDKLKEGYPNVYKVLIEERNQVIANNIKNLMESNQNKKILVILGAGHIDDVISLIKETEQAKINYKFSVG